MGACGLNRIFSCKVGDSVRVRYEWNPMAPVRKVINVDESTGEVELDCTWYNDVRITEKNAHIWQLI